MTRGSTCDTGGGKWAAYVCACVCAVLSGDGLRGLLYSQWLGNEKVI